MTVNQRFAAVTAVLACVIIGSVLWFELPRLLESGPHRHYGHTCLRQIGLGLSMYASDYDGRLPASMADLYPHYIASKHIFACPSDPKMPKKWQEVTGPEEVRQMIDAGLWSFRYVRFLDDVSKAKDTEKVIIAFGKQIKRGKREGRTVLFLDGHVEFMREDTFHECLNNMLTFDHISPEQRAYWRGFIDGMKAEGEG